MIFGEIRIPKVAEILLLYVKKRLKRYNQTTRTGKRTVPSLFG